MALLFSSRLECHKYFLKSIMLFKIYRFISAKASDATREPCQTLPPVEIIHGLTRKFKVDGIISQIELLMSLLSSRKAENCKNQHK